MSLVRGRLEALVTRAVQQELVSLADERDGPAGLWSPAGPSSPFREPPLAEPLPFSAEDFRQRVCGGWVRWSRAVTSGDHMLNPEIADIYSCRRAPPGRRPRADRRARAGGDDPLHAAHRDPARRMPARSPSRAGASIRRMRRRGRGTARGGGGDRPAGVASSRRSAAGRTISPAPAIMIAPIIAVGPAGLHAPPQSGGGGRRVRGAAFLPHGPGQPPDGQPRLAGLHAHASTRCPSGSATSGASRRASCASSTSGSIDDEKASRMIRPSLADCRLPSRAGRHGRLRRARRGSDDAHRRRRGARRAPRPRGPRDRLRHGDAAGRGDRGGRRRPA